MSLTTHLKSLLLHLEGFLRCCLHCQMNALAIDLYCERCWRSLEKEYGSGPSLKQTYLFPTYSLIRWNSRNEERMSDLLYALKGGGRSLVVDRFAGAFCFERRLLGPLSDHLVFVPAPPRRLNEKDHAYELARAFAELWGGQVACVLERPSEKIQKRLAKEERWDQRLQRIGELNPWQSNTTVIFVDDLVTSGATAAAAFIALGKPSHFEVWTLACREHLATPVFL